MTAARRQLFVSLIAGLLVIGSGLFAPATAACHVAAFVEPDVETTGDAGQVVLTVELQGRVSSCEGTVDYATEDGSATAGSEYEAASGTLEFVAGDDREEDITITILSAGPEDRDFRVVLSNTTGSISGTGAPATVTISGASDPDTAGQTESEQPSEPASDEVTPEPVESDVASPAAGADEDGSSFPWVPVLAVLVLIGLGAGLVVARSTRGR